MNLSKRRQNKRVAELQEEIRSELDVLPWVDAAVVRAERIENDLHRSGDLEGLSDAEKVTQGLQDRQNTVHARIAELKEEIRSIKDSNLTEDQQVMKLVQARRRGWAESLAQSRRDDAEAKKPATSGYTKKTSNLGNTPFHISPTKVVSVDLGDTFPPVEESVAALKGKHDKYAPEMGYSKADLSLLEGYIKRRNTRSKFGFVVSLTASAGMFALGIVMRGGEGLVWFFGALLMAAGVVAGWCIAALALGMFEGTRENLQEVEDLYKEAQIEFNATQLLRTRQLIDNGREYVEKQINAEVAKKNGISK